MHLEHRAPIDDSNIFLRDLPRFSLNHPPNGDEHYCLKSKRLSHGDRKDVSTLKREHIPTLTGTTVHSSHHPTSTLSSVRGLAMEIQHDCDLTNVSL